MKWFRAYHSILDSVKVRTLPEPAQLDYWLLLCCAAEFRAKTGLNTGETGLTPEQAAWRTRRAATMLESTQQLATVDLVAIDASGLIVIPDWSVKQQDSDNSTARTRSYRKRISKVGGYIGATVIASTKSRDGHACVYCSSDRNLCIDHAMPIVLGGDSDPDNLVTACKACNSGKAGRTPDQAGYKFMNQLAEARYRKWCDRHINAGDGDGDGLEVDREKKREEEPRKEASVVGARRTRKAGAPTQKKGTRLKPDWLLPKAWGEWALQERPAWMPERVREVAACFRDHWLQKVGKDAASLDWQARWRNWVRKEPHIAAPRERADKRSDNMEILTGRKRDGRIIDGTADRVGGGVVLPLPSGVRESGDDDVGGSEPPRSAAGVGG